MPAAAIPQHHLHYAPHSRRRWRRVLGAAVVLAALLAAALHWGPPLARQAKLLHWQRQCMRYTAPPDRLVVEEATEGPAPVGNPFVAPDPLPLQRLRQMAPKPPAAGAVLFLGERRTPGGRRRLVVIRRQPSQDLGYFGIPSGYDAMVINPARLAKPAPVHPFTHELVPSEEGGPLHRTAPLRFFAGQRDPADESHFTIAYTMNAGRHTIDGWLRDPPANWDPEPMRAVGVTVPWVEPWVELRLRVSTSQPSR